MPETQPLCQDGSRVLAQVPPGKGDRGTSGVLSGEDSQLGSIPHSLGLSVLSSVLGGQAGSSRAISSGLRRACGDKDTLSLRACEAPISQPGNPRGSLVTFSVSHEASGGSLSLRDFSIALPDHLGPWAGEGTLDLSDSIDQGSTSAHTAYN